MMVLRGLGVSPISRPGASALLGDQARANLLLRLFGRSWSLSTRATCVCADHGPARPVTPCPRKNAIWMIFQDFALFRTSRAAKIPLSAVAHLPRERRPRLATQFGWSRLGLGAAQRAYHTKLSGGERNASPSPARCAKPSRHLLDGLSPGLDPFPARGACAMEALMLLRARNPGRCRHA